MALAAKTLDMSYWEKMSSKSSEGALSEPPTDTEHTDEPDEWLSGGQDEMEPSDTNEHQTEAADCFNFEDGETEGALASQSANIKGDLRHLLKNGVFRPTEVYSACHTFDSFPDPGLKLRGGSSIPLPLSQANAQKLISECKEASIGKSERNVGDKDTKNSWELEAAKIVFKNPKWNNWVDNELVPLVCKSLGVDANTKPKTLLRGLFVDEAGSYFLPRLDASKSADTFAVITVILPSKFTGGAIQLSHGGENKSVNLSSSTTVATHAIAWYTGLYHSLTRVDSGYRVALSYELVHQGKSSTKPGLPEQSAEWQELQRIFASWQYVDKPIKLVHLLDREYSRVDLRGNALLGKDRHIFSYIKSLAHEFFLHVCLINVEESCPINVEESYSDEGSDGFSLDCFYDVPSDTDSQLSMDKLEEPLIWINEAFDLNGCELKLNENLELDDNDFIPYPLHKTTASIRQDERTYGSPSYRRTGLLMWPDRHHLDIGVNRVAELAKTQLETVSSYKPTWVQQKVVKQLVAWLKSHPDHEDTNDVVQVLIRAAVRWKSANLWNSTCRAGRMDCDLDPLDVQTILEHVRVLGFERLSNFLMDFIVNNGSDKDRFDLLDGLEKISKTTDQGDLRNWLNLRQIQLLHSLRFKPETAVCLVDAIQGRGCDFLRERIIPPVKKSALKLEFVKAFINALLSSKELTSPDNEPLNIIIKDLVQHMLSQAKPYPKSGADAWFQMVTFSLTIDKGLPTILFNRMKKKWNKMSEDRKRLVCKQFLPDAIRRVTSWTQSTQTPSSPKDDSFKVFWELALKCYMEEIDGNESNFALALRECGGALTNLEELVLHARQLAKGGVAAVQSFITTINKLARKETDNIEVASFKAIIGSTMEYIGDNCPLGKEPTQIPDVSHLLSILRTFFTYKTYSAMDRLLQRIIHYMDSESQGKSLPDDFLSSFIPRYLELAQKDGSKSSLGEFPQFLQSAMTSAVKALGPPPRIVINRSNLPSITCACTPCKELRDFLCNEKRQLSIKAPSFHKYLESHFGVELLGKLTKWEFSFRNAGYYFYVDKPKAVCEQMEWAIKRNGITAILALLGPAQVQKELLGPKWDEVAKVLQLESSSSNGDSRTQTTTTATANNPPIATTHATSSTIPMKKKNVPKPSRDYLRAGSFTFTKPGTFKRLREESEDALEDILSGRVPLTPPPKRKKPSKKPIEIIEISD